jgi:acyl-CoA reductase-like NAD-dependent aldehyde dehydrogenase
VRDIVERLREKPCRLAHETEDQSKIRRQREREEAADLIEYLRLFAHYANNPIEGMVEEAVEYKKEHGKYPFED